MHAYPFSKKTRREIARASSIAVYEHHRTSYSIAQAEFTIAGEPPTIRLTHKTHYRSVTYTHTNRRNIAD